MSAERARVYPTRGMKLTLRLAADRRGDRRPPDRQQRARNGRQTPGPAAGLGRVLVAMLALAALLPAASIDEPTQVTWPGGRRSLAAAVELLRVNGNQVELSTVVKAERVAYLPPVDGLWWQGVLTLCAAYRLQIQKPHRYVVFNNYQPDRGFEEARVEGGPLVLTSSVQNAGNLQDLNESQLLALQLIQTFNTQDGEDRQPRYHLAGSYLLDLTNAALATTRTFDRIDQRAAVAMRIRLEPRWNLEQLGPSQIRWEEIICADGTTRTLGDVSQRATSNRAFRHQRQQPSIVKERPQVNLTLIPAVPAETIGFQLRGFLSSEIATEQHQTILLAPGQTRPLRFGSQEIEVFLYGTELASERLGRNGPVIGLRADQGAALLEQAEISISDLTGRSVQTTGVRKQSQNAFALHTWSLRKLGARPYRVKVLIRVVTERLQTSVTLPVLLP